MRRSPQYRTGLGLLGGIVRQAQSGEHGLPLLKQEVVQYAPSKEVEASKNRIVSALDHLRVRNVCVIFTYQLTPLQATTSWLSVFEFDPLASYLHLNSQFSLILSHPDNSLSQRQHTPPPLFISHVSFISIYLAIYISSPFYLNIHIYIYI